MTQEAYRERFGARLHKTEERLTQLCDAADRAAPGGTVR